MRNRHGDFIWYELLTRDPGAAKRFYDPVAGWTIEPQASGPMEVPGDQRAVMAKDPEGAAFMLVGK